MKKLIPILLFTLIFSGCGTVDNGRSFHRGGSMSFITEEREPGIYYIEVKGAGVHSRKTVEEVWHERASEVSGGEEYESETVVERYNYSAPAPMPFGSTYHSAYIAKGIITIK